MQVDPSGEYHARLARWRERLATESALDARLAVVRLIVFGAAVLLAFAVWQLSWNGWLFVIPVVGFIVLVARHERAIRARDRSASLVAFYERGLERIEDRWATTATGATGDRYRSDVHPYANDLDLFGSGSLFELLSLARTRTLDSHASRLRRKLDPDHGRFVVNLWGVGYRLLDG